MHMNVIFMLRLISFRVVIKVKSKSKRKIKKERNNVIERDEFFNL